MANTLKIKRGSNATVPQGELAEPLFTTDTYDLYIGKGSTNGNQRFQKYITSGTSTDFIKGDGTLDGTTYQATSEKGQNNGYASLDAGGKVPAAQLPNSVMEYKGTWNANTNNPTLADGTGNTGDVYIVSVGGTQNLGSGSITFEVGDWVMYNGAIWQKSTNSNAVVSVNGQTGVVTITFNQLSPMTTLGDIIYGGASGAGTRLAGNITTTKKFLIQTGDGTNSAAPSWGSIAAGDVPTLNQNTTGSAATLTTARTLTIGATGKTFDGSANVSWSLADIGAEPTLTKGNLTETTSSVLTITGGTGAVIGSGTTIAVASAGAAQNGVVTTGTQTFAGAKTLTALLTGTRLAMSDSITSGAANTFSVTQTQRNGTDTGDSLISASHSIVASSASNQLVIRAMSFGSNNNLTGGGVVTNYRVWNVASSTQTGTTTTHLDQIYIEKGTADGTVTNNRAIRINNMQGTNRAAFFVLDIGDGGTNNSYMVLGSDASATIPTGNWGIYQIQSGYNNYFNGKLLVKTTTDAGFALDVSGTARTGALTLTGALSGTSATFSGNIGLGITPSTTSLNTIQSDYGIMSGNLAVNIASNAYFNSGWKFYGTGWATLYNSDVSNGKHDFYISSASGTAGNAINWGTAKLSIASTGAATFTNNIITTGATAEIMANGSGSSNSVGGSSRFTILDSSNNRGWILQQNASYNLSFWHNNSGWSNVINFTPTGAATFSSSVTAGNTVQITGAGSPTTGAGLEMGYGNFTAGRTTITSYNRTAAAYVGNDYNALDYIWYTSGSQKMTLTNGGNVGIGTAPYSTFPDSKLHVYGTRTNTINSANAIAKIGGGDVYISFGALNGTPNYGTWIQSARYSDDLTFTLALNPSGGDVLINTSTDSGSYALQVNGSVYATAYYESSDIRIKDVLTNSYSENFSAIEFMWKDKRDDKKHWGYAAQDVMRFIPDAIEVNKDGMMTVNYNEAHTWKIAQLEAKIVELEAKLK